MQVTQKETAKIEDQMPEFARLIKLARGLGFLIIWTQPTLDGGD
jgi:hypothetical protein